MKTRLSTYAAINYPVDWTFSKKSRETTRRRLQKQCERGELTSVKEGGIWFVIGDGKKGPDDRGTLLI